MAGKNHFRTHCGTHTWIEIELADFLYNWRGEYDFYYFVNMATVKAQKVSNGSEIWIPIPIPILTNRTCLKGPSLIIDLFHEEKKFRPWLGGLKRVSL